MRVQPDNHPRRGSRAGRLPRRSFARLSARAGAAALDAVAVVFLSGFGWDFLPPTGPTLGDGTRIPQPWVLVLATAVVMVCYHVLLEGAFDRTPGKLLSGVRVVDAGTLGRPSPWVALRRNLLRPLEVALLYLPGFLLALANDKRRSVGDLLGGTLVVDARFRQQLEQQRARDNRERAGRAGEALVSRELARLCGEGSPTSGGYYVFEDLYEPSVGNIDHLVAGPGGVTIVETKAHRGVVSVPAYEPPTLDGRPLERDVLGQVANQRRAVMDRMGLADVDPERVRDFHWLICFPRATLGRVSPAASRHVCTLGDLRARIRGQRRTATAEQVQAMAGAIARLYGKLPDHEPPFDAAHPADAKPDDPDDRSGSRSSRRCGGGPHT